jgi:hypothetical protein
VNVYQLGCVNCCCCNRARDTLAHPAMEQGETWKRHHCSGPSQVQMYFGHSKSLPSPSQPCLSFRTSRPGFPVPRHTLSSEWRYRRSRGKAEWWLQGRCSLIAQLGNPAATGVSHASEMQQSMGTQRHSIPVSPVVNCPASAFGSLVIPTSSLIMQQSGRRLRWRSSQSAQLYGSQGAQAP